jgi:FSR family fosmidomycin resistance protein-like MFS transporter
MKPEVAQQNVSAPAAGAHAVAPSAPGSEPVAVRHPRYDYWVVVSSHALVDIFPMFIVSLMIVLQDRLALTRGQETMVWVATPIFSGGFQPLFAWLSDRYDTRLAGPLGLAVGAVCIGSIGFAQSFGQLLALQIVGVIGIGMYHPTAAAVAGQAGARALHHTRAFAVSIFVASGMVGHTVGPILATRVNDRFGLGHLAWIIPPTLVACVLLHRAIRDAPHRPADHPELRGALTPVEARARWWAAGLLSAQNALRFTTNTGMFILFSYWAAWRIPGDPDAAAILNGNLAAAMTIGMGIGALLLGRFLRPGREKIVFALTAFGGAIFVASINIAAEWGRATFGTGGLGLAPAYLAAALAAVGFFATVPASVGLGQRLLPSHATLVTALLLGIGWVIGALARPFSSALLGGIKLDEAGTLNAAVLNRAFAGFAVLIVIAGVLALLMPTRAIRDVARDA